VGDGIGHLPEQECFSEGEFPSGVFDLIGSLLEEGESCVGDDIFVLQRLERLRWSRQRIAGCLAVGTTTTPLKCCGPEWRGKRGDMEKACIYILEIPS